LFTERVRKAGYVDPCTHAHKSMIDWLFVITDQE
jgi:hypothetical protein